MAILRTRTRKILRDIVARRGRSVSVVLSILIGVFGVTAMVSISDLLSSQLQADLRPEAISHTHLYVRATGDTLSLAQNQAYFDRIAQLEGVTDVEGQGVYRVAWRSADNAAADYTDGYIVTFTEPFGAADLEPVARVTAGRYPVPGAGEIAVEQRFADTHNVTVGDTLVFFQPDGTPLPWTVTGLVLHPYFTIDPAIQDQIPSSMALFAHYDDAQQIVGFTGLTAIHVRYINVATAEAGLEKLTQTVSATTPYTIVFNFLDDPDSNFVLTVVSQVASTLSALGIIAMVVSGFLVTNVMNAIVVEQRKQIGTMKSIGATTWDNFYIYAGIALVYGLTGTVIGIALGVPLAALLAQEMAPQALTYIDGFKVSTQGVVVGVVMGLLVPVLAALLPVLDGMRVSILEAITDLGIASSWGNSRLSRWIGRLPFPTVIVQGISNIYQKRGRLVLTGLTLTMAAAAFMGVTALDTSLADFVDRLDDTFAYEIAITPQGTHDFAAVEALLREMDGVAAVYPGYSAAVSVVGYESTNPLTDGSDLVTVTGIDPAHSAIAFDLLEGHAWNDDPTRPGVVISRSLMEALDKSAGDTLTLTFGDITYAETIIGVNDYAFDAIYMDWSTLAERSGYVNAAGEPAIGTVYIDLEGTPSITAVDDHIKIIAETLRAAGIQGTYVNQPAVSDAQAQQISMFGVILNANSLIMAAVGAIGLMATLSMAVFERQKEIGVMRSVGATSLRIMAQFMVEGLLVGVLAWILAAPLSVGLGAGLMGLLPFDYLTFTYPPIVLLMGLIGIVVIAGVASIWPSVTASRKTVADILRYQ